MIFCGLSKKLVNDCEHGVSSRLRLWSRQARKRYTLYFGRNVSRVFSSVGHGGNHRDRRETEHNLLAPTTHLRPGPIASGVGQIRRSARRLGNLSESGGGGAVARGTEHVSSHGGSGGDRRRAGRSFRLYASRRT